MVPLFTIDADSGVIRVAEPNFEQGLVYEILILASDHGVPQPLESTAFLSVLVEKSNEKKPHLDFIWLTDSGNPEVYENVSLGYVLARILVEQENHERFWLFFSIKWITLEFTFLEIFVKSSDLLPIYFSIYFSANLQLVVVQRFV